MTRVAVPAPRREKRRTGTGTGQSPFLVPGIVVAAFAITVASLYVPLIGAGLVIATLFVVAVSRVGVSAAIVVLALAGLTFAGLLERSIAGTDALTQICTLLLIAIGILNLPRVRVPVGVAVAAAAFVGISTILSIPSIGASLEFGLRGWIALNSPIFIACAVAGVMGPNENIVDEKRARIGRWLFFVVVGAAIANVLVAGRQALFGLTVTEVASAANAGSTFDVGGEIRLMGTFTTNQDFGVFAACAAPAILVYWLKAKGRERTWLMLLSLALYTVVLLSLTRTALVASVSIGIAAFLVWGSGSVPRRFWKVAGVFLVGAALFAVSTLIAIPRVQAAIARAATLLSLTGDDSFQARGNRTLPRAIAIFQENLFGAGSGSAGPVSAQFVSLAPYGKVTTDNGYLMVGIQIGFLGVLAFVAMLVLLAVYLGRSRSGYSNAGAAAIFALLTAMILAGYWSLIAPMAITATIVGLAIGSRERETIPLPARALDSARPSARPNTHRRPSSSPARKDQ